MTKRLGADIGTVIPNFRAEIRPNNCLWDELPEEAERLGVRLTKPIDLNSPAAEGTEGNKRMIDIEKLRAALGKTVSVAEIPMSGGAVVIEARVSPLGAQALTGYTAAQRASVDDHTDILLADLKASLRAQRRKAQMVAAAISLVPGIEDPCLTERAVEIGKVFEPLVKIWNLDLPQEG